MRGIPTVSAAFLLLVLLTSGAAFAGSDGRLRWSTLESDHFFMHYTQGQEPLAREFLAIAEEAYGELTERFGFTPSERTQLVLVDDIDSANGLTMVVPYNHVVLYGYVPDATGELGFWGDWKRILVYHELTHVFHLERVTGFFRIVNYVLGKTYLPNSALPNWFIEGLAVNVESSIDSGGRIGSPLYNTYMRLAVAEDNLLTLDEITGYPLTLPRGTVPYLYGSYFMHWLAQQFGQEKLFSFVHEQAGKFNPLSLNISARRIFKATFVQLYERWQQALIRTMDNQLTALRAEGLREGTRLGFASEYQPMPSYGPDGSLWWTRANGRETQHLVRRYPDGTEERVRTCRGGCDRPQVAADGSVYYSAHQYHRAYYYYQDLYRCAQDGSHRERLTEALRVKDPSPSPDGSRVAYIRTVLGRSALVVRRLEDGAEEQLVEGPIGLAWPAWSPDGRSIAVSAQDGDGTDVLLVDLASGESRNVTPGPAFEVHPTFSPDGRHLLFSSSRTGIYNIYALDLEAGCTRQLTSVIGAAYAPTVHPDGQRVAYSSFHHDGHHLHEVPLLEAACEALDFTAAAGHRSTAAPPRVDLAAGHVKQPSRYNALKHLSPRQWMPSVLAGSFDLSYVGLETWGNDPARLLSYTVAAQVNTQSLDGSGTVALSVDAWYPSITLFGGYYRNTFWARPADDYVDYREDDWYSSLSASFPVRHTDVSFNWSVGYSYEHFTGRIIEPWEFDPGSLEPYFPTAGNLGSIYTSLSVDTTESYGYSVTTEKGISAATEMRLSTPVLGSNWTEYHVKWRLTGYVPLGFLDHHVLKGQLRGGWAGGRETFLRKFSLGGYPDQDIISDLIEGTGTGMGGTYLRGYAPGVVRGSQYHFAALDYFFPVWRIRRGFQTFPVFFKDLYVDLFGNAGAAFDEFAFDEFRVGAGAELRLKTEFGYNMPFTLTLGAAYGFQDPGGFGAYFLLGQ